MAAGRSIPESSSPASQSALSSAHGSLSELHDRLHVSWPIARE